ncbi:Cytochrome c, mono-and diheme variants [Beijerinckiaceae bacterium RH AL1]|nr:cytochrome c [Beijerinckiaceae bacterium]VVB46367.1 Cytochrome c, mono-and diheme variants [Beijerinckiaceae bacterium RH CH11]VVB46452.1 Cytochrome c, mono-and diheme variants [Beijerinckiaceae bacterium RH AL8]VVC55339.1 Cytochrome c, mono-and diheme variants [Beijerinckiaceae bacterium RH AL1]
MGRKISRALFVRSGLYSLAVLPLLSASLAGPAAAADQDLIKKGEYLATVGDCKACHTAPGGQPFAGGLYMPTPVGKISTPNLTPDKETGIGSWTDAQFYDAFHRGIDNEGHYLYPVFPFPWYTKVTKDDVMAIKAYLGTLKPVHAPRKPLEMAFPFNVRTALFGWRLAFFKEATFKPDPKASAEVNRGAYIVEGLGHCGECHNKANILGASVWSGRLEGGQIDGWYAPNITSDGREGVGKWKNEDIVTYLKTGMRPDGKTVALGPMHETIYDSTSHFTDDDLKAVAAYLKSTAAKQSISDSESSAGQPTEHVDAAAYITHCASCHGQDGKGQAGVIPPLAGNGAVTSKGPENVIRVVLGGLEASNGLAPMPAYGSTMSDQEIADATNYVRSHWGNQAPANAGPGEVAELRKKAQTMLAMNRPQPCAPYTDQTLDQAIKSADVTSKLEKMDIANMLPTIDDILPGIKKGAPSANPDNITNALIATYCPIAKKLPDAKQSVAMGDFAVLTYGQAKKNGQPN